VEWGSSLYWLDVLPATQPSVTNTKKLHKSINSKQWPGLIRSSSTTGLLVESTLLSKNPSTSPGSVI